MKLYNLCDGPGPNPKCPQLVVNNDGSAIIGEEKEGIGLCYLDKRQFERLKQAIKRL